MADDIERARWNAAAAAVLTERPAPERAAAMAAARPTVVAVSGLSKSYGAITAVASVDVTLAEGDFCAILGPSGCGKTTLLRMIAGFIQPTTGRIAIDGRDVTRLGPERRPTNMVFQSYGLFPHMTVAENVGFGLRIARVPAAELRSRVEQALALVRLDAKAARSVAELSGGQQQRVALARALIMRPRVLLLDEPLAALDLKLRHAMQDELRRIHRESGGTFLFVTHDQSEAFNLASRVLVMNEGRIEQDGSPDQVYLAPTTRFVASFVGEANMLSGRRTDGMVTFAGRRLLAHPGSDGAVTIIIRPEALTITAGSEGASRTSLAATIREAVFLGAGMRYLCALGTGETVRVQTSDLAGRLNLTPGTAVMLGCPDSAIRVLEA